MPSQKTSEALKRAYRNGLLSQKRSRGGYRADLDRYFRSGWEANFARMLNYMEVTWEYEPQAFEVNVAGETTTYTPDFFLPAANLYVELKGWWVNAVSKAKYQCFAETHSVWLIESPTYQILRKRYRYRIPEWEGK